MSSETQLRGKSQSLLLSSSCLLNTYEQMRISSGGRETPFSLALP